MAPTPRDSRNRKGNLRLALILASVAAAFVLGFVAKMYFLR